MMGRTFPLGRIFLLWIARRLSKGCSQILGMEPERSWLALIKNAIVGSDQIHAVWPPCVCNLNLVIKAIHKRGKLDAEFAYARTGYKGALLLIAGAAEQHFVTNVALHLPYVGGMGFQDVDRVEIDLTLVLLRQFVQGGNLPPKWRSGIAAENENDWPFFPQRSQSYGNCGIECLYGKVWRFSACVE